MKTNMKNKVNEWLAMSLVLASLPAMAQEHVGNGGGEDVEFHKITSELQTWLTKNQALGQVENKLSLESNTGSKFIADFSSAVQTTTVKFQDEPVIVGGQSRVCGNDVAPNRIVCNRNLWNHQVAGNVKYAIVFHEYLGVAGYERNLMDYSQYTISKNILGYVYEKLAFELGMEKVEFTEKLSPVSTIYNRKTGEMITFQVKSKGNQTELIIDGTRAGMGIGKIPLNQGQQIRNSLTRKPKYLLGAMEWCLDEIYDGLDGSNGVNDEVGAYLAMILAPIFNIPGLACLATEVSALPFTVPRAVIQKSTANKDMKVLSKLFAGDRTITVSNQRFGRIQAAFSGVTH